MKAPIFVVGANRSGTTLLRLVLNAHPRIAIPEEIVYFGSFMAGVPIESWQSPPLAESRYAAFVRQFIEKKCAALEGIDHEALIGEIMQSETRDFRRPYQMAIEAWARLHGKERWGEKTPGNLFYADVLRDMFPDARFIHMVRDPRAGVSSMMKTSFFPKDIVFNAMSRHKFMTRGRDILETAVPASHRTTLRYEDLVTNPEPTIKALCNFLEEDFHPEMLSFYKDSSRYMKTEAATSFNKAATQPISKDNLEKWKAQLSPGDIARIEAVCRGEMVEYNYPLSSSRVPVAHRAELLIKQLYWKLQEWRHRKVRHYTVKSPMFARLKGRFFRS